MLNAPLQLHMDRAPGHEGFGARAVKQLRLLSYETDRQKAGEAATALLAKVSAHGVPAKIRAQVGAYRLLLAAESEGSISPALEARMPAIALLEVIELLCMGGQMEFGARLARHYHAKWPQHEALRFRAAMVRGEMSPGAVFRDDPEKDVQVISKPGAQTTMLVFGGIMNNIGVSYSAFYHFWLARLNANVVFLRSFDSLFFLGGLRSVGTPDVTIARLREIIAKLGAPRTVALGYSSGSLGAHYYGNNLSVDQILAFSGPSSLDIGLDFANKQNYPKAKALHEAGKLVWPDIRAMHGDKPGIAVECFYAERNEADKLQALHLKGLPNVQINCIENEGSHYTPGLLAALDRLDGVLARAVSGQ